MRPVEIIKVFPFIEFCNKIDVTFVAEQLVKLLLIWSMRAFDFSIELRRAFSDISMSDSKVFNMPMEFRLEFMTIIRSDFSDPEWELFYDVIDEVDRIGLRMFFVDL